MLDIVERCPVRRLHSDVPSLFGDLLYGAIGHRFFPELPSGASVGAKIEGASIVAPPWGYIISGVRGQAFLNPGLKVDEIKIGVALGTGFENQGLAIGSPLRAAHKRTFKAGQLSQVAPVKVHDPDFWAS